MAIEHKKMEYEHRRNDIIKVIHKYMFDLTEGYKKEDFPFTLKDKLTLCVHLLVGIDRLSYPEPIISVTEEEMLLSPAAQVTLEEIKDIINNKFDFPTINDGKGAKNE